ncbi:alpha/beta hydrolase [Rhizobium johnstonii]|uniref:alpha/beta hydrolase n=1 Tax=Rhizobium johnstonii TaxID=3019933 RepID=UPI003F98D7B1
MTTLTTAFITSLPLLFNASTVLANDAAAANVTRNNIQQGELSSQSSIGDVLRHPAFSGFARRILPWDDRAYDEKLRLQDIASLLPYHSHVDPASVVGGLNRMITDISAGRQVFYDIYSNAEKTADPQKKNTGLFFFRGKAGAPFAIVAPGGGFAYVGSVHEGFPYAAEINRQGYNVFVLKYRVGQGGAVATQDLARALSFIFENHSSVAVTTEGYSLWGSSAGARMAASIGSHGAAAFGGDPVPKPSAVVMAYTGHSDVGSDEPPTFVVVGSDDGIAPASSMQRRVNALRNLGASVEYREFPSIGHGFGPGIGTSADGWITDAVRFWEALR